MTTRTPDTDEIAELKKAFAELQANVAELNASLQQVLHQQTEAGSAEEATEDDLELLRQRLATLRERGEVAARELAREVEQHPLASVGIAFGIGYLLARLTGGLR